MLDIQRAPVELCRRTAELLRPGGTLLFSTNLRRFRLDDEALAALGPRDITAASIPQDFRNKRIHRAFELTAAGLPDTATDRLSE